MHCIQVSESGPASSDSSKVSAPIPVKEKAYPLKIKALMSNKKKLVANRRGIVRSFMEVEKPSFSAEELFENRSRGISYSSIGKKLGIDNTKEEVVKVFKAMKDCDTSLPSLENVEKPICKSFPTPLWFLFNSELDIVAQASNIDRSELLATGIQQRVASRLGERANELLVSFMEVNDVIREEISSTLSGCGKESSLGKINAWTNELPSKVLVQSSKTFGEVAKAGLLHVCSDLVGADSRCRCGGTKVLKFKWEENEAPSFFWGCGRYRPNETYLHDRTKPLRSSLKEISSKYVAFMSEKDIRRLVSRIEDTLSDLDTHTETDLPEEKLSLLKDCFCECPENVGIKEYIRAFADGFRAHLLSRESNVQRALPMSSENSGNQ